MGQGMKIPLAALTALTLLSAAPFAQQSARVESSAKVQQQTFQKVWEVVRDKFFDNATIHFPRAHAQAVCDTVLGLADLASVATLEDLLAQAPQSFT